MSVYFVQRGKTGPVKIGRSGNVPRRVQSLQGAHADVLTVRLVINGADEQATHRHFSALRIRGEWFRFAGELRAFLSEHAGATEWSGDVPAFLVSRPASTYPPLLVGICSSCGKRVYRSRAHEENGVCVAEHRRCVIQRTRTSRLGRRKPLIFEEVFGREAA